MATIALSNIIEITKQTTGFKGTALNIGGQPMAVFRILAGAGAAGDTATLQSAQVPVIQSVEGAVGHNMGAGGTGLTAVTVSLLVANTVATNPANLDVIVFGPVPQS